MYRYVHAKSTAIGIEEAIKALNEYGIEETRENQDRVDHTKEIQLCLDIDNPCAEPAISRCIFGDINALISYDHEMIDGTADDKGWKYTYHQLYSRFYDQLIDELKRNINTRRACIAMGQGDINFSEDPPCMQMLMFNYVEGKLDMTVVFRSNDGVKAFPMNIHAISLIQMKVAHELGVPVGAMHYIANNFHCYSRDYDIIGSYVHTFETANEKRRFWSLDKIKDEFDFID